VERGELAHRLEVVGVAAVEVLVGEGFEGGERDRAGDRQLALERQRPLQAGGVEPQRVVVDTRLGLETFDRLLGVGPTRD
jgi:hypothetical protein